MAAQPANADIKVYQRVRSFRQQHRHETVEAITKNLRPQVMSVPSKEQLTEIKTRDTSKKDFSPYGRDGQPVVVGLRATVTKAVAIAGIDDVAFPVRIGNDVFLENSSDGVTNDIQGDLRSLLS